MLFDVTADRIARSKEGDSEQCAIALTVRETLPHVTGIMVWPRDAAIGRAACDMLEFYEGDQVRQFVLPVNFHAIYYYDYGRALEPFKFELPIESSPPCIPFPISNPRQKEPPMLKRTNLRTLSPGQWARTRVPDYERWTEPAASIHPGDEVDICVMPRYEPRYSYFASHSFMFAMYWPGTKDPRKFIFNGGLIFQGPSCPADGSFLSLTISLSSATGWFCHT